MEKLNIAELLRGCPTGMELDCTCAENVVLDKIIEYDQIKCVIGECSDPLILDKYGRLLHICCPKCVIFPKGKTTWEGFQIPFKDGDIITCTNSVCSFVSIFKKMSKTTTFRRYVSFTLNDSQRLYTKEDWADFKNPRFATEEEKQKLFDAIKANGYKWNAETKTLEKLIEPKFKVGDRVKEKKAYISGIITDISNSTYRVEHEDGGISSFIIKCQDDLELVPTKFDITTLKPFESKVLVRTNNRKWVAAFYSHYDKESLLHHCVVGGLWYEQCVPYNGNEHLLDTTNDCEEYYKTWE